MTGNKYPVTPQGFDRLNGELRKLKTVERQQIIETLSKARELGDLSENAEYKSAKEKQAFIEGKIAELEDKLSRSEVIDIKKMTGNDIKFGASVVLCNLDNDTTIRYKIVGMDEADISIGHISFASPISRGLIGRKKGDVVDIITPGGIKNYEVVNVVYE